MYKRMRNEPMQLLKQFAYRNSKEGVDDENIKIEFKTQLKINDMIDKQIDKVMAKVKSNFTAQRR